MFLSKEQPIGVFDSGVGGLTVANAIRNLLPSEKIIYFGDTAHLPYGDKSSDAIRKYSIGITEFLLQKNCKTIVIACNTASAHAFITVKDFLKKNAPEVEVINVIEPAVEMVTMKKKFAKVGIIGTKGTIRSEMYPIKIKEKDTNMEVVSLATPLLVPMIEEGFIYDDISNAIIRSYLSNDSLKSIDALILGCTHYPIIKNQIRKFFDFQLTVIDSSQMVAAKLKEVLNKNNLLCTSEITTIAHEFYVSDYTDYFKKIAEMFFDDEVDLIKLNIWN